LPLLRVFAARDLEQKDVEPKIDDLLGTRALPLTETVFLQHAVELAASARWDARTLELLDRLSRSPFIDVAWMDRCPLLAPFRENQAFIDARARIATRAAQLWT
jgi:hypothetical protein